MLAYLFKFRQRQILNKLLFLLKADVDKSFFKFVQYIITLFSLANVEDFNNLCKYQRLILVNYIKFSFRCHYSENQLLLRFLTKRSHTFYLSKYYKLYKYMEFII